MLQSVEAKIANLLFAHLHQINISPAPTIGATIPAFPGLNPNGSPKPWPGGVVLLASPIMNTSRNRGLGANDSTQFRGIFQVSVHAPVSLGGGIFPATEIAAKVCYHFERGTPISDGALRVKIEKRPDQASPFHEDGRVVIPVSINWHCFA